MPEAGSGRPFLEVSQGLTPALAWVVVTPRVWAWVHTMQRVAEVHLRFGLPVQIDTAWLAETYVRTRYPSGVVDDEVAKAEEFYRSGGHPAALLPTLDPVLFDLVRFGLVGGWDGFDRWAEKFRPADPPPDDSPPSVRPQESAAPKSPRRRAPTAPALFS